jgi:transcriptional regulator with XRE-family HTH domain
LDVREILRRLRAGETDRAVAQALGVARRTVSRYRRMAEAEGFLKGPLSSPEVLDRWLKERMPESRFAQQVYKAAPYREAIEGLRRAGVERRAVYERLREDHGYTGSYSALWRYVEHLEGGR